MKLYEEGEMSMTEDDLESLSRTAFDLERSGSPDASKDYLDMIKEIRYLSAKYEMLRTETLKLRRMVTSVQGIVNS